MTGNFGAGNFGAGNFGRSARNISVAAWVMACMCPHSSAWADAVIPLSAATHAPDAPAIGCGDKTQENVFGRFYDAYADHLKVTGEENGPAPAYRDSAAPPLPSPPFPSSTWNIGGSPPIGYEDTSGGPLMDSVYCGKYGQAIKDSRVKVYGWLDPSYNFSTSHTKFSISNGVGGNYPASYDAYSNSFQLDQATLYIERVPDTVQKDHIDWGFRFANLYGADYKYTFSQGVLSNQYLKEHHQYGYDPVMAYGDVYIPSVAQGMNIRFGRYISIPDIEAQLAPDNYTFSHSLLYSFDPYTQEGVIDSIKLSKNWLVQFEISNGNDVAMWKSSSKLTPAACASWTSDSGNDNIYPCLNGVNGGEYAYNNIQMPVVTWYHKFNSKWHMATEAYYLYENNVPNVNNPNAPPIILGSNGAFCKDDERTCTASAYAFVNYIEYQFAPLDFLSLRNEFLNDEQGQRSGYKTRYSEHLLGWSHWIGDVITVRPELRYEHSYNEAAYDNGNRHDQTTVAADVIFHY